MAELQSVYIDRTGDWVRSGNNTGKYYLKDEVDEEIESLKASHYTEMIDAGMENHLLHRSLWLMTAEWADAMCLASCNIAIKLSVKERFFYHDEANREKDIKKYRHRQVVFARYADYCRAKADTFKEDV